MYTAIFSVYNSIVGASSLVIPYALAKTGLVYGVAAIFLMYMLNFYTTCIVAKYNTSLNNFSSAIKHYAGNWLLSIWLLTTMVTAAIISFVNTIVFSETSFVIIQNYFSIETDQSLSNIDYSKYNIFYHKIIAILIVSCLVFTKNLKFIIKLTGMGAYCLFLILIWINCKFWESSVNFDTIQDDLFKDDQFYLFGVMIAGYITQPTIGSILKEEGSDNYTFKIFIGYTLAMITYIFIGISGYYLFYSDSRNINIDNVLDIDSITVFGSIIYTNLVRVVVCLQYLTLIPLLVAVSRMYMYDYFYYTDKPSERFFNNWSIVYIILNTIVNICYPKISTILNYAGCLLGLCITTIVPIFTNICILQIRDDEQYDNQLLNRNENSPPKKNQNKFFRLFELTTNYILIIAMILVASYATYRNVYL